jgi:hypothetical protein
MTFVLFEYANMKAEKEVNVSWIKWKLLGHFSNPKIING